MSLSNYEFTGGRGRLADLKIKVGGKNGHKSEVPAKTGNMSTCQKAQITVLLVGIEPATPCVRGFEFGI